MFEARYGHLDQDGLVEAAQYLLNSMRGQLIVSQALHIAINEINKRPPQEQEPSNVADMELFLRGMFPLYPSIYSKT